MARSQDLKVRLHFWTRIRFKKRRDGKNKANPSPRDIRPMLFKESKNLVNKTEIQEGNVIRSRPN